MKILQFLRWIFSNSGAVRGTPDAQALYVFQMGRHPLHQKKCSVCGREYWAFTSGNYYCGRFACFREAKK